MADVQEKLMESVRRAAQQAGVALPDGAAAPKVAPLQLGRQAGLDEPTLSRCLAETLGIAVIEDVKDREASAHFLEKIPISFARQHRLLGLAASNGYLPVAISDVAAFEQLQVISRFLGRPVKPMLAPEADILSAINAAYQSRTGTAQTFIQKLDRRDVLSEIQKLEGREDLLDVSSRAPVIKLVNLILFEAVQSRASDVHIQPYEDSLVVRMRIDGVLYDQFTLPKALQDEMVSRVKVMARMNIAEKRLAQDGRATVEVGDRTIDLRIASLPTSFGERVVIRLLDKSARLYTLEELGMEPAIKAYFRELISVEHGLILVTGPTGSGKSTTLYAALQEIDKTEKNVLTLEDPIEFRLEGISQTQVSDKKGMTFASGLRSVLRQDPDVIMVGEIRDKETAVMAIQSALTGHLVFSTLHTNDAASAITRLLDLGIEPYLLASSVVGVLAQRLVRRICPNCAKPYTPSADELSRLGLSSDALSGGGTSPHPALSRSTGRGEEGAAKTTNMRMGAGCPSCRKTGYSGRVGIFELLLVDENVRAKIQSRATASAIKSAALGRHMKSLRDDGIAKIAEGKTTIEEVLRVTMRMDA